MQKLFLICVLLFAGSQVNAQPSSFPASGVELHHRDSSLPLYPQLTPNQVSTSNILWCSSANNTASASWKLPGGVVLNAANPIQSGIRVSKSSTSEGSALGLFPNGTSLSPGIYKCCITDERGQEHILAINLVPGGVRPVTSSTSCAQISASPTRYALSFALSNMSPTSTTCRDDNGDVISDTSPIITCLNDTQFGFRYEFTTNGITCDIASGPAMASSITVQCSISTLPNITVPMLPSSSSQILSGAGVIPGNNILPVTEITSSNPIWCQGSSTTDIVMWRLPDGTLLSANSNPTGGARVITAPGQLGLIPTESSLPSGVYTCIVNSVQSSVLIGNRGEFGPITQNQSPMCSASSFPTVVLCAPLSQRLPISISCTDSNGISACVNCSRTTIINGFVPISYQTCVPFTNSMGASTYTCIFSDGLNQVTVSCSLSNLPQTTITSITRPPPGSQFTISWNPITSPGLTGYNITLSGSDGSTRIITTGPTTTTQTITGLNPQTTYNVSVTPLGNGTVSSGTPSPTVVSPPVTTTPNNTCEPGQGFEVDVKLYRDTSDINCTQLEQQNTTMLSIEALNAVLLMNNALDANCTNPILSVKDYSCNFADPSEATPKSSSKKSKKGKKGKKEKSPKGRRQKRKHSKKPKSKSAKSKSYKNNPLAVSIKARVVCSPCRVTYNRKRRDVTEDEHLVHAVVRGRIVKRKKSKSKSKSKTKSKIIEEPPSMVTVKGVRFNVTATDRGSEGLFCQGMSVTEGTTCDCPLQC